MGTNVKFVVKLLFYYCFLLLFVVTFFLRAVFQTYCTLAVSLFGHQSFNIALLNSHDSHQFHCYSLIGPAQWVRAVHR